MIRITSDASMKQFGISFGRLLQGGEVIELIGDVGAGKTTFTKGLATGFGVDEDVQSPSFTISRTYEARDGMQLAHYDFYRLHDAGIMHKELQEASSRSDTVVVIEWAEIVEDALPKQRITLKITPTSETGRTVEVFATGDRYNTLLKVLQ